MYCGQRRVRAGRQTRCRQAGGVPASGGLAAPRSPAWRPPPRGARCCRCWAAGRREASRTRRAARARRPRPRGARRLRAASGGRRSERAAGAVARPRRPPRRARPPGDAGGARGGGRSPAWYTARGKAPPPGHQRPSVIGFDQLCIGFDQLCSGPAPQCWADSCMRPRSRSGSCRAYTSVAPSSERRSSSCISRAAPPPRPASAGQCRAPWRRAPARDDARRGPAPPL